MDALLINLGNDVVYRQDHNDQWANLMLEIPVSDEFVAQYLIPELSDMCGCVIGEGCPWCREIARLMADDEIPF